MLELPGTLVDGQTVECDICVMGAGAAGITLAMELDGKGLNVCLLEAGGLDAPPLVDTHPYAGESVGVPYDLLGTRLRYFGGATNHWAGWCIPLDRIDFRARSYVPLSGWPLERSDLDPYYGRASRTCEIDPPGFDLDELPGGDRTRKDLLGNHDPDFTVKVLRYSPPTRFGSRYRSRIEESKQVTCFLNCTVAEIEGTSESVSRLRIRAGDKEFFVRSRVYVLALGAIENARLLLCSDGANRAGMGNENDLVGRCFADHVASKSIGSAVLSSRAPYLRLHDLGEFRVMPHLSFGDDFLEMHELPNFGIVLTNQWTPEQIFTAGYFADARLFPEWAGQAPQKFWVSVRLEVTPNRDSRITLMRERDPNGMRRARIDWRVNSTDLGAYERVAAHFGRKLGQSGAGRFRRRRSFAFDGESLGYQAHHMGTTRMSVDPGSGVANSECRVHSVDNLYIAGSSLFPTYGFANPTLTLVALALRLADHLKQKVLA